MTMIGQIVDSLNTVVGLADSAIAVKDFVKNEGTAHVDEIYAAIQNKSKEAYDLYCAYREHRKEDIGVPEEKDILGYWEACLTRDVLPSVADMVSEKIASKEEAEIMLEYLLEAWMGVPDFANWLHDVLAQNKLDEIAAKLKDLQKNMEGISAFTKELEQQSIRKLAYLITPGRINDAKHSCKDMDTKHYYMVDNRFWTMFKVISSGRDVPHTNAVQTVMDLAEGSHPVIITGNGGMGKTNLMMHAAVKWASRGRLAVWLSLSNSDKITEQKASEFYHHLTAAIPAGQKALVCIDNPYEGRDSFSNLRKAWPDSEKIQLILTERANRLTVLAEPTRDCLMYWFDDAQMILLKGCEQLKWTFKLKEYETYAFFETRERQKKILDKCTLFLEKEGIVQKRVRQSSIKLIMNKFSKPTVSLVELIYRTLFELKKKISKPEDIKLDWEEWEDFIETEFGKGESYSKKELYGVIAALKVFHTPIKISLFCKFFNLNERRLKNCLSDRLMSHHCEPVILHNDTLYPKHDVVAELFFLFHKSMSFHEIMKELLRCMNEDEIEAFLTNIVVKKEFKKGKSKIVGQIPYRDYMDVIYNRMRKEHNCNLSETGKAYLCLGYLWSRFQQDSSQSNNLLGDKLNYIAPEIDNTRLMKILYTEWGIWARESGDYVLAEEKYRKAVAEDSKDIVSRTELGKLLSKQKGREKEAEEMFRKVIKIDSRNIQSRTELGKLISKQPGREKEAEEILRKALTIDRKNLHPHTELGILLLNQQEREKEAEEVLREAMEIDKKHVQSRTVLGKLLLKQGREEEAEEVLREALRIDSNDIYPRNELKKLLLKQWRKEEAKKLN